MFQGVALASNNQASLQPNPQWSTRMTQHSDPVVFSDLLFGCCCVPCASASAKTQVDRTPFCFNFCCFTPCGSYSWIRNQYAIQGVCGDDLGYGVLCPCCTTRQAYTEARIRGPAPGTYQRQYGGSNSADWAHSLFDCGFIDCCRICFCPCCVVHDIRKSLQPSADSCCFDTLCISPFSMYGQVRHSYGIISDFGLAEDICLPVVCYLCALNRAARQVKSVPLTGGGGGTTGGATSYLPSPQGGYGHF